MASPKKQRLSPQPRKARSRPTRTDLPFSEAFGIEPQYLPEGSAPPVDERRLVSFIRHELSPAQADQVLVLVAKFKSWNDALRRALLQR